MERKNDEEGEIKDLIVEKKKKRMTKNFTPSLQKKVIMMLIEDIQLRSTNSLLKSTQRFTLSVNRWVQPFILSLCVYILHITLKILAFFFREYVLLSQRLCQRDYGNFSSGEKKTPIQNLTASTKIPTFTTKEETG